MQADTRPTRRSGIRSRPAPGGTNSKSAASSVRFADYGVDARITAVERQIAALDATDQVDAIETEIRKFDLDGKVAAIEKRITALDVGKDRRDRAAYRRARRRPARPPARRTARRRAEAARGDDQGDSRLRRLQNGLASPGSGSPETWQSGSSALSGASSGWGNRGFGAAGSGMPIRLFTNEAWSTNLPMGTFAHRTCCCKCTCTT